MGAGMAVRQQVVRVAEVQVIAGGAIYGYSAEVQVEAVLVGKRMAARTERTGAETEESVLPITLEVAMCQHLSGILHPQGFGGIFGKWCAGRVHFVCTGYTVDTHIHIGCRGLVFIAIPDSVRVSGFAGDVVCQSRALAGYVVETFVTVTEAGAHAPGRPGIDKCFAQVFVKRVLQEVGACDVGHQRGNVPQGFHVGMEVALSVVPFAVAVEAGCRGAGSPELVTVFQYFFGRIVFVGKHQAYLQHFTVGTLPIVVVENMVFYPSFTLYVVVIFGNLKGEVFYFLELFPVQSVVAGIVGVGEEEQYITAVEVINQFRVGGTCQQSARACQHFVGISLLACGTIGSIELVGVLPH